MRYFRMYIVISMLMTGVMKASEASAEGAFAGVDEEPPQQVQKEGELEQNAAPQEPIPPVEEAAQESQKKAPEVTPAPAPEAAVTEAAPQAPPVAQSAAPQAASQPAEPTEEPEPTIEDAEAEFEEFTAQHEAPKTDLGEMPAQPGALPSNLPEEPKSYDVTTPQQPEEPAKGIDTVDLEQPQGNWLFKRYWWERAEEVYKKIRVHVEKINDMRVKFFARRTELDKVILDPFYADIGLTQSDLQTSMQNLMSQLEQEKQEQGMLTDEERELMETVQKDRERLQQLEKDVRAVGGLRDAADRVVDRVMDQKNRVAKYETEAWDSMREIGRIVSDMQASELYYRMDASWRTVKDVYKYIDQDLNKYFDKLLSNAREQTERIKTALQALKEQGVDLKARIQQAQADEFAKEVVAEEDKEKDKAAAPKKTGWFGSSRLFQAAVDVALWQFLQSIWDAIMWLPRRIYSTITSIFR